MKKEKRDFLDGFKIGETSVVAKELSNDELVVSFLNLLAYITDEEIIDEFKGWGVMPTSPVKKEDVARNQNCRRDLLHESKVE